MPVLDHIDSISNAPDLLELYRQQAGSEATTTTPGTAAAIDDIKIVNGFEVIQRHQTCADRGLQRAAKRFGLCDDEGVCSMNAKDWYQKAADAVSNGKYQTAKNILNKSLKEGIAKDADFNPAIIQITIDIIDELQSIENAYLARGQRRLESRMRDNSPYFGRHMSPDHGMSIGEMDLLKDPDLAGRVESLETRIWSDLEGDAYLDMSNDIRAELYELEGKIKRSDSF